MSQFGLEDSCNLLDIGYPVVAARREVAKFYNAAAKKNHPDKVPEKEKRAASKRMQALTEARDLLFALFDRNAWQGSSTPLVYDRDKNKWNCEVDDKILVSRHHCTTIA